MTKSIPSGGAPYVTLQIKNQMKENVKMCWFISGNWFCFLHNMLLQLRLVRKRGASKAVHQPERERGV